MKKTGMQLLTKATAPKKAKTFKAISVKPVAKVAKTAPTDRRVKPISKNSNMTTKAKLIKMPVKPLKKK